MNPTGRMGVGLLGDSPAGTVIASALGAAGHALIGRSVPPEDRAEHVDVLLPGVPVLELGDIVRRSELVIVAAEADALDTLVRRLDTDAVVQPGQIVLHVSLERGLNVFSTLAGRGVIPLRLYPLIPMTGTSIDVSRLRGQWCAVSAPTPALPIAQALAIEMGMEPLVISESQQDAFVSAVNRATSDTLQFVHGVVDRLEQAGVDHAAAAVAALIRATADQALRERSTEPDILLGTESLFEEGGSDGR